MNVTWLEMQANMIRLGVPAEMTLSLTSRDGKIFQHRLEIGGAPVQTAREMEEFVMLHAQKLARVCLRSAASEVLEPDTTPAGPSDLAKTTRRSE